MNKDLIYKKTFTRRALVLGSCKALLVAGLLSRMFYLQVINNKKFEILSDRNNAQLALNEQKYQLIFEKLETHNKDLLYKIALKIGQILSLTPEIQASLINDLKNLRLNDEVMIEENLNWQQLLEFEFNAHELTGFNIVTGFNRIYPFNELCGHLTGYIGTISNKDKPTITYHPDSKVGKNGIEKTQEKLLHGTSGIKTIEVNAKSEYIKEISNIPSINGQDVQLSIDIELQKKAAALLDNNTGVILVSKIDTGEILCSVSNPSFNPNLFNNGISANNWNNLLNNPELPLIDRSVALTYPPGSGFKVNVAIAALKNNLNPLTIFHCPGHYTLGNRKFRCWNKAGHGQINLYQAIAGSCNVYFWNVARIIGIQSFADMARIMGYDQKLLNNSLPREQNGIIPDPEWKSKAIGSSWTISDTLNAAIGQGYVEATPIQILTMVSRIASGKQVIPTIFKKEQANVDFASLNMEKELQIVKKGMEMATGDSFLGTAYRNRILIKELAMAGKTGTSQVISKRHADDDLSRINVMKKIRNHGIFVSYAPIHQPKYAFCGIIEHGGTPALAVKIAKELLTEAQLKNI